MSNQVLLWIIFNVFVLGMLALDLGVFHRKAHVVKVKEALLWSAFWIVLSLLFNLVIYFWLGPEKGLEFLAGYLTEKSLSIDNIFVFLLIFSYFRVPPIYQHKVLFWGILGGARYASDFHRHWRDLDPEVSLDDVYFRSISVPDRHQNGLAEG